MFGDHVVKRFTAYLDPDAPAAVAFLFHAPVVAASRSGRGRDRGASGALAAALARPSASRWLEGALLVLWFAVPMVIISAGTSKLYHYAYPFLPPVALAGGYGVATIAAWIVADRSSGRLATERGRTARALTW